MPSSLKFELVTPEKLFASVDNVRHVRIPGAEGAFGVLPNHMPLIATLAATGEVEVDGNNGKTQKFTVKEGFVEVTGKSVTVLAKAAEELN